MARSPKGTLIRTLPEWHFAKLSSGSFSGVAVADNSYIGVGLFNNSTDGSVLVVWDVEVKATPSAAQTPEFVRELLIQGQLSGALSPVYQLQVAAQTAWGQITANNPYSNPHGELASFPIQNEVWKWGHEWPMCALLPGYSLVMVSDNNGSAIWGVSFIWESVKPF